MEQQLPSILFRIFQEDFDDDVDKHFKNPASILYGFPVA